MQSSKIADEIGIESARSPNYHETVTKISTKWVAAILIGVMTALMIGAALQDSATVDETTNLAAGYSYWKGHRYQMVPNHPALSQMLEAAPLMLMDVKISDPAAALLKGQLGNSWMLPWAGPVCSIRDMVPDGCKGQYVRLKPLDDVVVQWNCPTTYPIDNWYYWATGECQLFGKYLLYGGDNDGDAMLLAGRLVQIGLTLLTGLVIFIWIRRTSGDDRAALLGLALWSFNPMAIAYGHLTNTDISVTLGMTVALYLWGQFLEGPNLRLAVLCGAATGVALTMKFTAVILAPIFVVTLALSWKRIQLRLPRLAQLTGLSLLAMWGAVLLVYFPRWAPVRPPTDAEIVALNIPGWFRALRPVLIPPDFFKVIAMALGYSAGGHEAYLMGKWSPQGWWYYFPAAFVLKSSVAFVILTMAGFVCFIRRFRSIRLLEYVSWLAAGLYLALAMTSHVNIGVRHLLPMVALCCVGIGCAASRLTSHRLKLAAVFLAGWQVAMTLVAYPLYIQYFSEVVGGSRQGYRYLIDSNYDWGQDARRLKTYLDTHGIRHIYLNYFGTQFSTEYLKIPNTRVTPEQAQKISEGYLVVSVSELMRPDWDWLRNSRSPVDRVADTLFVYRFP